MQSVELSQAISKNLRYVPGAEQALLIQKLAVFLQTDAKNPLFILSGYAGTGKTSVLGACVKALSEIRQEPILLAPTGRAAKVLGKHAGQRAYTIHKYIYRSKSRTSFSQLELAPNLHKRSLFIVDESSMIGEGIAEGGRDLLSDLLEYVYSGRDCKLILLGDAGQLPPVGEDFSPAMDSAYMRSHFPQCHIETFILQQVMRQESNSSILEHATMLRSENLTGFPKFQIQAGSNLIRIDGHELQDALESSYNRCGTDETIIITRSNKRANNYNQQIRNRIFWYEEEMCSGDLLMVVKNNYSWLEEQSPMGFIANGELLQVKRIKLEESLYGFRFLHILASFPDYPDVGEKELIINLDTTLIEGPSLPRDRMKELFFEIEKDYSHLHLKKERYDAVLNNPYFNALQVKFAYAVTCHKAQGGQWQEVYIDQGMLPEDMDGNYYRWLYTALTRAEKKAYLVNFSQEFFADKEGV